MPADVKLADSPILSPSQPVFGDVTVSMESANQ